VNPFVKQQLETFAEPKYILVNSSVTVCENIHN